MLGCAMLFLNHCAGQGKPSENSRQVPASSSVNLLDGGASGPTAVDDRAHAGPDLPVDDRVLIVSERSGGERQESWLRRSEALGAGYTIVDLSDDWTPFIFAEQRDASGQRLPNRYRRVFIGLANDLLDGDGEPLEPGQKNYLELYGIFPSLSVLRERFLSSELQSCVESGSPGAAALAAVDTLPFLSAAQMKRDAAQLERTERELDAAMRKAKVDTLADLASKQPNLAGKVHQVERKKEQRIAFAEIERRLACEGLLKVALAGSKPDSSRHTPNLYDEAMQAAVRDFQQKNMLYEANYLRKKTMAQLSRPALANDYEALVRALRERVVAAAGVIEDGSVSDKKRPIANLAEEYTRALLNQLGFTTPEGALTFFKRHPASEFKRLVVGIKLPPRPEYYSAHMELSLAIDRGDVWYEPPFDENDKWHPQPRSHYPTFTLSVDYRGERIPLVRWRTTTGGWRSEQASDGYEYYKYKGSDVGPRVMRQIISGPVWIAPESTPIRGLVKTKMVDGLRQSVVNYDELGPGYLSAYGLVAGYLVIPGEPGRPDNDRGIRIHGSSNYLSIYNPDGYSHGCHRLPNHLAIRLYDFLLQHRRTKVNGDAPMNFWRQFLAQDQVFEIRIPSRGYVFELDPPLPVDVSTGNIRGSRTEPIEGYVQKPGVRYPGPPPGPPSDQPKEGEDTASNASVPPVSRVVPAGDVP